VRASPAPSSPGGYTAGARHTPGQDVAILTIENAAAVYGATFFGIIAVTALAEAWRPRRALGAPLLRRWAGSCALAILDTALVRLLAPISALGLAALCAEHGWGLFNRLDLPSAVSFAASLLLLDLGRYALHYALHRVPLLWRMHEVHHADPDFDFTTALRFHPLEAVAAMAVALAIVAALGPPVEAVLISEMLVIGTSILAHGNIALPPALDRILRRCLVTPDMHRVHHSTEPREANVNFGSILPWWDRAFGTYVEAPHAGHAGMTIGLAGGAKPHHLSLRWMLFSPFCRRTGGGRFAL
jgi:sterol desaturase/sphingolipid hydroxylase (fatty acid hydroxylase superfamily)